MINLQMNIKTVKQDNLIFLDRVTINIGQTKIVKMENFFTKVLKIHQISQIVPKNCVLIINLTRLLIIQHAARLLQEFW